MNFLSNPSPTPHVTVFLILFDLGLSCSLRVKSSLGLHIFKTVISAYTAYNILGELELLNSRSAARAITGLCSVEVHGLSWNYSKVIHVDNWLRIISYLGAPNAVNISWSLSSGSTMWLARPTIRTYLLLIYAIFNIVAYTNWCRSVHNFFDVGANGFIVHVSAWAVCVCTNLACQIEASVGHGGVICAVIYLLLAFDETDWIRIWV